MIHLTHPGPNQTLLYLPSGAVVLFSYATPVAAFIPGRGYVRTDRHYSVTTTRHINQWVRDVDSVPQSVIDALLETR